MGRWFNTLLVLLGFVFLPIFTTPAKAAPISVTTEQLVIIGMPATPFTPVNVTTEQLVIIGRSNSFTPVSVTTEQLVIMGMPATSFTPISVTTEELVILGKP